MGSLATPREKSITQVLEATKDDVRLLQSILASPSQKLVAGQLSLVLARLERGIPVGKGTLLNLFRVAGGGD